MYVPDTLYDYDTTTAISTSATRDTATHFPAHTRLPITRLRLFSESETCDC